MKTINDSLVKKVIKIILLIVTMLIIGMFFHSFIMIHSNMNIPQIALIDNSFISEDSNYILHFDEREGFINSPEETIEFEYGYEKGIVMCRYYETIDDNGEVLTNEKQISFIFVRSSVLYSDYYNMLFALI